MDSPGRIDFHDQGEDSAALLIMRDLDDRTGLGFGIELNGLDLVVTRDDARRLAKALLQVVGDGT